MHSAITFFAAKNISVSTYYPDSTEEQNITWLEIFMLLT